MKHLFSLLASLSCMTFAMAQADIATTTNPAANSAINSAEYSPYDVEVVTKQTPQWFLETGNFISHLQALDAFHQLEKDIKSAPFYQENRRHCHNISIDQHNGRYRLLVGPYLDRTDSKEMQVYLAKEAYKSFPIALYKDRYYNFDLNVQANIHEIAETAYQNRKNELIGQEKWINVLAEKEGVVSPSNELKLTAERTESRDNIYLEVATDDGFAPAFPLDIAFAEHAGFTLDELFWCSENGLMFTLDGHYYQMRVEPLASSDLTDNVAKDPALDLTNIKRKPLNEFDATRFNAQVISGDVVSEGYHESLLKIEVKPLEKNRRGQVLYHILDGSWADHNSESVELGSYKWDGKTLTLYTYWARLGDAPVSPFGGQKITYHWDDKARKFTLNNFEEYSLVPGFWQGSDGRSVVDLPMGKDSILETPRTPEDEKLINEYISAHKLGFHPNRETLNRKFLLGDNARKLMDEVRGVMKQSIEAKTGDWEERAKKGDMRFMK